MTPVAGGGGGAPGGAAAGELDTNLYLPLLLSAIAGSATALGGLVVLCLSSLPSQRTISLVLAFAAGVMTCVSVFDLWWPQVVAGRFFFATSFAVAGAVLCSVASALPIGALPEREALAGSMFGKWATRKDALPSHDHDHRERHHAWRLGALLALVLTVHNLPEGTKTQ